MPQLTHRVFRRKRLLSLRRALFLAGIGMLLLSSSAHAYNFTYFGGRQGRPGVDSRYFLYTWSRGPTGGTLTWYLARGELTIGQCDAGCFAYLTTLVPPELAKWAAWIDLTFAQVWDSASADVVIRFTTATGSADAQAWQWVGNTLTQALIRINPNQYPDWAQPAAVADFSFTVLHEWGHCLGLGDLYWTFHGVNTFEAEDFTDHNPSDPSLPNTQGKGDNVMETYGVMTLDNDEIYAAQWLWGNIGGNAITCGDLQNRVPGENANQTATHHGQPTWTYWGTVTDPVGPTVVSVRVPNICTAFSIGPGVWNIAYFPERIDWTVAGPYQGNFVFQISDTFSTSPEWKGVWAAVDTTIFNAPPPPPPPPPPQPPPAGWPGWTGPVFFPGVFGIPGPCQVDIFADTLRTWAPVTVGPFSTCGAGDNCDLRPGEDVVIQIVVDSLSAGRYTFSLCDAAFWDTYLYLYADYCSGTLIASDDDGCGIPGYTSEISCQYLAPGTYYLDVEPGTPEWCGDFTLTVTACSTGRCCYGDPQDPTCAVTTRPECDSVQGTWYYQWDCDSVCPPRPGCSPDSSLFAQYPHLPVEVWSGIMSEATQGLRGYEDYSVAGDIGDLHFWGLNISAYAPDSCREDSMPFSVGFFPDSSGYPASAAACSYEVNLAPAATGLQYYLLGMTLELLYYATDITPACSLRSGWVSVQGAGDPDCWLLWISSPIGDRRSVRWEDEYEEFYPLPFDLAVCLTELPCDTSIRADSVTIGLDSSNTNAVLNFRAPVAGQYIVWTTLSKIAVFPTGFLRVDTVSAGPGFNIWTDPTTLATYRRYAITHTCP